MYPLWISWFSPWFIYNTTGQGSRKNCKTFILAVYQAEKTNRKGRIIFIETPCSFQHFVSRSHSFMQFEIWEHFISSTPTLSVLLIYFRVIAICPLSFYGFKMLWMEAVDQKWCSDLKYIHKISKYCFYINILFFPNLYWVGFPWLCVLLKPAGSVDKNI